MARQPYFINTTTKQMEVYGSFGGGMVTQEHPEKLRDDQFTLMENVDIVQGGVVQNRGGYQQTNAPSGSVATEVADAATQGFFRFRTTTDYVDIVAINGKLYKINGNAYTQITITGLTQFQTTRQVDAIQTGSKMYIATGSGVVIVTGTSFSDISASAMVAYTPNALEVLYVGTNGYATNPDNYITDVTSPASTSILGVTCSTRYGIVNTNVTFTAYIEKPSATVVEYKFEAKLIDAAKYTTLRDWSTTKTCTTKFSAKGSYVIVVSLRVQGTTTVLSQYTIPKYTIKTTADTKVEPTINFDDLKLCNRIFLHYDRLFLYGDTGNKSYLYISHLNNFTYFPRTNIIDVTDPLRGSLQGIVQYRDFLVCFTSNSIQAIRGRNPAEYERYPIHTTLGTSQPYSIQVMKNYVTFVGTDYGVYVLKSFSYASEDKLNVQRIDEAIMDTLTNHIKGAYKTRSCIYNNQYYLYVDLPGNNYTYRFYYELGVWVRDYISVNWSTLDCVDNVIIGTSSFGGIVHRLSNSVFKDGVNTSYSVKLTSKDYNFGLPHHRKKLKQYQLLVGLTNASTINVKVYADNTNVYNGDMTYDPLQNSDAQKLKVMLSGRFRYTKVTLTMTVNELVRFVGFGFVFKQGNAK